MNFSRLKRDLPLVAGIAGPAVYVLVLVVLGALWANYNPVSQSMSEIGSVSSPFKDAMNYLGFSLLGVFIMLFSLGFRQHFKEGLQAKLAFACIAVAGLFMFLVGFFPCDAGCIDVTETGKMHSLTSVVPALLLPIAAIISASIFAQDRRFGKKWGYFSFAAGLLSMSAGPLMFVPEASAYLGLVQRLGIGFSLLWVFLVSVKLFSLRK